MDKPRFVVLSTGRAGSAYIARLLTLAGIKTGHEQYYHPVRNNKGYIGDSSWMALVYVENGKHTGKTFHQVRNPLNVIGSLMNGWIEDTYESPYNHYNLAQKHGDYKYTKNELLRWSIEFVYDWNERCEQVSEITWQLEKVNEQHVYYVANRVGVKLDDRKVRKAVRTLNKNVNKHRPGPNYTWEDLPDIREREALYEQARRYGYIA